MTAIGATTSTPAVTTSMAAAASAAATAAPTLLPAPQEFQNDPLSMLYLFQSQNEQVGLSSGTAKVQGLEKERHADLVKEQSAIAAEVKAAKHKSFWEKLGSICSEIAKVAGVVAAVAAAVATCGAASPLAAVAVAGAVLSTAGFVSSETNVLQKLGISGSLANILNTAMSAGGSVMSMGAASLAGAGNIVATASGAVSGAGHLGSGASTIGSGEAQAAEDNADADQVAADDGQDNLTRLIAHVLQEVQDSDDQSKQMLSTIGQTKGIENQTALAVASGMKA